MKTFHEIENALRDYHWMIKEIQRLREELNSVNVSITTKYGVEASMPKGNKISKNVESEVISRERKQKTLKKFEDKVKFIETNCTCIEDDRELAVLNCILDGLSIVSISQHLGFSERKVYMIKDEIVKKIKENAENAGFTGIAG